MKEIFLTKNYGGFKAGQIATCNDDDAETLFSEGVARSVRDSDYSDAHGYSQIVDEVVRSVKAELKGTAKSDYKGWYGGNFAPEGWGSISPRKFWSAEGNVRGSDFDNVSDFLTAVLGASKGQWDSRLARQKDLHSDPGFEGGFLIPSMMANWVYSQMLEDNPFMNRCTLLPMDSSNISVPFIAESSRATTGLHGIGSGKGVLHVAEEGALADISPTFGSCNLKLHKIGGRCRVSNEMLEDSRTALSALLPRLFSDALNWRTQWEFINGSGAGECLGILNAPATISVTKEAGQGADSIVTENIVKMWSRLLPSAQRNAVWMANLDTLPQLLTLTVNVGTGGAYVWLVGGDRGAALSNAAPLTILGKPLFLTEHCSTVGDQGDIIAFDPRAYAIGRKVGSSIRIEASEHYRFENDQVVYRAITRLDGQPLMANPITPVNSTTTLSAFVTLDERA